MSIRHTLNSVIFYFILFYYCYSFTSSIFLFHDTNRKFQKHNQIFRIFQALHLKNLMNQSTHKQKMFYLIELGMIKKLRCDLGIQSCRETQINIISLCAVFIFYKSNRSSSNPTIAILMLKFINEK